MRQPNDRRQLVLQTGCRPDLAQGKASVFECFEHPECIVETEDDPGRDRVVIIGVAGAHMPSLANLLIPVATPPAAMTPVAPSGISYGVAAAESAEMFDQFADGR